MHGMLCVNRSYQFHSQPRYSPQTMYPEASSPYLRHSVIDPYPEPAQSSPGHCTAFNIHFNTVFQYTLKSSTGVFLLCFYAVLFCPWCATCSNHPVLLDLRTGIISGEAHKSCNTSTSAFLHLAVTSSSFGTNKHFPSEYPQPMFFP